MNITPGPWVARPLGDSGKWTVISPNGYRTGEGAGLVVATICNTEADARLIAMAPEMYAVIERTIKQLNEWRGANQVFVGDFKNEEVRMRKIVQGIKER